MNSEHYTAHPTTTEIIRQAAGLYNGRNLFWACRDENNFGDLIGPYLFHKMTGKNPIYCQARFPTLAKTYFTVGSILHHVRRPDVAVVWGSGIIQRNSDFAKPARIHAVRGPHTRERCLSLGYDCPNVFGDPAILMPRYYKPQTHKRFEVGIVPHMVDYRRIANTVKEAEVSVIDVCQPVETVIEEINKCELIIASSLHGMILAHAYGIKAAYTKYSDHLKGDGVKFLDYLESFGEGLKTDDFMIDPRISIANQIRSVLQLPIPDTARLGDKLLEASPF